MSIVSVAITTVTAYGLASLAVLVVVQVVIATAAAQRAGHVPGVAIADGPASFAFRAQRAHQNTLENALPFLIALAAALALGVAPALVDVAVIVFLAARVAHAITYYLGVRPARTASFAVGVLAILTMSVAALVAADPAAVAAVATRTP